MGSDDEWFPDEIEYLKLLQAKCSQLSTQYTELYRITHSKQTNLRIPSIILSSFSGIASFGTTSFPADIQRYVSITVGIINIGIAMLQTYESYLKIPDIVTKSLTASSALKRLSDDIDCELYLPVQNRKQSGETYLRDCYNRYQSIMTEAPPLVVDEDKMMSKFNKNDETRMTLLRTHTEPMSPMPRQSVVKLEMDSDDTDTNKVDQTN